MTEWLRRIRGAVGIGLTWAAGWTPVGAILGLVGLGATADSPIGVLVISALFYAVAGFLWGTASSVVLGIAEGRRRLDQMSLPRFAGRGAALGDPS